jgi:hypothetical protein
MTTTLTEKRLYRIMDFSRVVQIFDREEIYFAKPSSWDDPYEQQIKHAKDHAVFAQCWGENPTSDAMWRIYSQHGTGVRISTTVGKLEDVMANACREHGYKKRLKPVRYCKQAEISKHAKDIAFELKDFFNISRATDILYFKRDAFIHETEWRATLFTQEQSSKVLKNGVSIKVNPHEFIDRILLDPRAPEELIKAFRFYFKEKLGFKGSVSRSALYKAPEQYIIDSRELTADDL